MKTLYLLKSGKYCKVGICKNLSSRIKQYSTHNPDFMVIATREGTDSDEYYLHKLIDYYGNEWVKYSDTILELFKTVKLNHRKKAATVNNKKRNKHIDSIKERHNKYKRTSNTTFYKNGIKVDINLKIK